MRIVVAVHPRSRRHELRQVSGGTFSARVQSPPEAGKANEEVISLVAEYFKIPKTRVRILGGFSVRNKLIEIRES